MTWRFAFCLLGKRILEYSLDSDVGPMRENKRSRQWQQEETKQEHASLTFKTKELCPKGPGRVKEPQWCACEEWTAEYLGWRWESGVGGGRNALAVSWLLKREVHRERILRTPQRCRKLTRQKNRTKASPARSPFLRKTWQGGKGCHFWIKFRIFIITRDWASEL